MTYLKIGWGNQSSIDFSDYVSGVEIQSTPTQKAQVAASGLTKVDYQGMKHIFKVTFKPLLNSEMTWLQTFLMNPYQDSVLYIEVYFPDGLLHKVNCYIDKHSESYYTLRDGFKLMNKFSLTFKEF